MNNLKFAGLNEADKFESHTLEMAGFAWMIIQGFTFESTQLFSHLGNYLHAVIDHLEAFQFLFIKNYAPNKNTT